MKMNLIILLCFTQFEIFAAQNDPCDNHNIIADGIRATGYKLPSSGVAISDDRLDPGWYKIINEAGTEMPTEPPGLMSCGTLYPIWLDGLPPTDDTTEVSRTVCVQMFVSDCQMSWNIAIKKCPGNFLVYNLVESETSNSAYCFGKEVQCPDGEYSETGFTPDCSNEIPEETFSPVVQAELAEGNTSNPVLGASLEPVFRCEFEFVIDTTYAYDVYWFINNQLVIVHKRIPESNINDTLLRPEDWVNDYTMNMLVRCSLRVRLDVDSVPGPTFESPVFEAGVKPESTTYEVIEGEEISVLFSSSVPVGCIGSTNSVKPHCTENLKIAQPEYQNNPSNQCVNTISSGSMVFEAQECGITFSTINWMVPVNLRVKGYIDNIYNSDNRKSYIRLLTEGTSSTDPSGVWDTVNIPEVEVTIIDRDSELTGRYCGIWDDPTYRTTDGKWYNYHGSGEHVVYRNKIYPYSVHTLATYCEGRGTCNCGIAIQSHDSLFVVRTCDTISTSSSVPMRSYPFVSYTMCNSEHMTIQNISMGHQYKVTLPIGTEVTFDVNDEWIPTIIIKPSTLDIEQTEGLCGFVSKIASTLDDYISRGSNSATTNVVSFATSWRIDQSTYASESLFSPFPTFVLRDLQLKEYCICTTEANQIDDISKLTNIHCNLTQPIMQCENANTNLQARLYQDCPQSRTRRHVVDMQSNQRKTVKRNAVDSDDLIDETPLTYHENYDPNYLPPDPEWKNGWNENSAREECTSGISEMIALELCTKYANIDVNLYISFCVEDIKTAGSADYIPYMVSLMEGVCKLEISRNESLFSNTSGNDGLSILDTILDLMCPNNCHNNGVCNKTECICDNGYIGFDCSMTLADAPKSITVPDDGLCGTKSRGCKKTNVFGVFNAPTVYCKLNHFTVGENGKQMSGTETFVSAVYSYENLISCEFPSTRRRRSTDNIPEGYDISLSFDQTNYGDTVSIIIYDDDCFTCNSTSIICIKLDSCSNFTTGTQSSTSQLNPATTKTNYVEMATQKAHDTESEESGMSPGIYGAIGGAIVLVTVIGVVIYKWGIRKQSGTKKILAEGIESITKGSNSGCSGTAPTATNFPTHYIREQSDLSFSWPESSRPNTPANLFLATSKKA